MPNLSRTVGLLALSFAVLSLTACKSGSGGDAPAVKPISILAQQHGQQSALKLPTVKHITSVEQFEALGLEGAKPAVFDTEDMVVAALGEQNTGGHWVRVTGLQQVGDTVYIQATVNRPAEDAPATEAMTQPYCVVTTPKLGDNINLATDFTSVVGQTPPTE